MASSLAHTVSFRTLLWFYAVIPLCLLAFLLDYCVLDYALRDNLPSFPQDHIILNSVFGLPHILASSAILLSCPDYYQHYKNRLWIASILIMAALVFSATTLSYAAMFFIIAGISAAHLLRQQFGIGNILCHMSGPWYTIWCWSSIVTAILVYNCMFQHSVFSQSQMALLEASIVLLLSLHVSLTLYWHQKIKQLDIKARLFLWGNCLMICIAAGLYFADYYFFAALAPRVIHDITAFYIYVTHDKNRLIHTRPTAARHVQWVMAWPLVFIVAAYLLLYQLDHSLQWIALNLFNSDTPIKIALGLITFLNLFHYYTETFTWGKTSPYRQHLSFSH